MRAVAHGWKKPGGGGPSQAVAREFVNADRKYSGGFAENRYWTGGLAAMNEVNSGVPETLNWARGGRRGRRRNGGGGGGGRGGNWPQPDPNCESGWVGKLGNCRPVPGADGGGDGGGAGPPGIEHLQQLLRRSLHHRIDVQEETLNIQKHYVRTKHVSQHH